VIGNTVASQSRLMRLTEVANLLSVMECLYQ